MRKLPLAYAESLFLLFLISFISACQDKHIEIHQVSDLAEKAIGCQTGTTGESFIQSLGNITVCQFRDAYEACLALKNKEIDAVIIDEHLAQTMVKKNKNFKTVDLNLPAEEYAVAVRKGDKELLDSINATIKKLKISGAFNTLKNAFMPPDGNIIIPEFRTGTYNKTLKMGTNASYPPFEYTNGTKVVGFDASFAAYIANDYGGNLQILDMSFASLFEALNAGYIDFICAGLTVTEERKTYADFSEPYFTSKQVIIVRK